jgi:hypothetical protein
MRSVSAGGEPRYGQQIDAGHHLELKERREIQELWLHKRKGRSSQWVILHDGQQIVTGATESERRKAETALADYIALKHKPDFGDGNPSRVLISDALNEYLEKHAPNCKRSDLIAISAELLAECFGGKTVSQINPERVMPMSNGG